MGNLDELELKGQKIEENLALLNQQISISFEKLFKTSQEIIKKEIVEIVSEIVKNQPDVTNNIGAEQLKGLKTDMYSLIEKIDVSLKEDLSELSMEKIIEKAKKQYDRAYIYTDRVYDRHDVEIDIEKMLGRKVGEVKILIEKYGYSVYKNSSNGRPSNVWDRDYTGVIEAYVYKGFNSYDLSQSEGIKEYSKLFDGLLKFQISLDKTNEKIASLKAESLWDSI